MYNFLWTIGFYCTEFCTLNIHSIWNLFLNFVRDYFSKQLNMACYRRLAIFTLLKIDVKITKISFCCCFHCDFQLVFYLSFLFFSERRLQCSVFIFWEKVIVLNVKQFNGSLSFVSGNQTQLSLQKSRFSQTKKKLSSRTILMKNNGQLIAYSKSIPLRTGIKSLFSGFWIDLKKMDRWIGDLIREDLE